MSVANGLSYHRNDPIARLLPVVVVKEWHREALVQAIKSRAGWARRSSVSVRWLEEDLEAIRALAEEQGWETAEESDPEGVTIIFEKGKQCKLLLLPCY